MASTIGALNRFDSNQVDAYLLLQNGSIYKGTAFGGKTDIDGEVGKLE